MNAVLRAYVGAKVAVETRDGRLHAGILDSVARDGGVVLGNVRLKWLRPGGPDLPRGYVEPSTLACVVLPGSAVRQIHLPENPVVRMKKDAATKARGSVAPSAGGGVAAQHRRYLKPEKR